MIDEPIKASVMKYMRFFLYFFLSSTNSFLRVGARACHSIATGSTNITNILYAAL